MPFTIKEAPKGNPAPTNKEGLIWSLRSTAILVSVAIAMLSISSINDAMHREPNAARFILPTLNKTATPQTALFTAPSGLTVGLATESAPECELYDPKTSNLEQIGKDLNFPKTLRLKLPGGTIIFTRNDVGSYNFSESQIPLGTEVCR